MANRYATLTPSAKIKDDFGKITAGFDKVQQEMDSVTSTANGAAQRGQNNTFTQNQTIHKDLPRLFYRPTSDTQTAHSGNVFTDSEGTSKWVQGHIPSSGIFALYDYDNAINRLVFESGPDMRATLNGITIFRGQTSPEGVLTAGPGAVCSVWSGAATVGLWVKMTGSGNTGWRRVAVE